MLYGIAPRNQPFFDKYKSSSQPICIPAITFFCCLFFSFLADTIAAEKKPEANNTLQIIFNEGRISLHKENMTNLEILNSLSIKAGFEIITIGEQLELERKWSFNEMPIEKVISSLVRPSGLILALSKTDGTITKVIIIGQSNSLSSSEYEKRTKKLAPLNEAIQSSISPKNDSPISSPDMSPPQTLTSKELLKTYAQSLNGAYSEIDLRSHQLIYSDDPITRLHAAQYLSSMGELEKLTAAIGDGAPDVRLVVIKALEISSPDVSLQYLGEVIFSDADAKVRLEAVKAISTFPSTPATRALLNQATKDTDTQVRYSAIEALNQ